MKQEVTIRTTSPKTYVIEGGKTLEQLNPKELLLLAGATCAGMSAMHIMGVERVAPTRFEVTVSGELDTDTVQSVSVFLAFGIRYRVLCAPDEAAKAERAVRLAHEKYCGAVKMLGHIAPVEHEIVVN